MSLREDALGEALAVLARGVRPEPALVQESVAALLSGGESPARIGALLMGLERIGMDGPTLAAGARAMRALMTPVPFEGACVDVCGTGGDGSNTLNISTAVAFVLAGCGLVVAKHGNRAMSSATGAADVLEALGVNLTAPPEVEARALREARVAFLFAQAHHPAMRHVAGVRRELKFRTIFNRLGPLSNPAGARRKLIGVGAADLLDVVADALGLLGAERGVVLHGDGGLDEAALSGPTALRVWDGTDVRAETVSPADAGLPTAPLTAVRGGDAAHNAAALRALLGGARGPYRDMVVLNAALALRMATDATDLSACARQAEEALDQGRARAALDALIAISNEPAP
jgi:anthranilate phosphoribosyltransferase